MSATVDGIIYLFGGMTLRLVRIVMTSRWPMIPPRTGSPPGGRCPGHVSLRAAGSLTARSISPAGVNKEPIVNPDAVYYKELDVFDPQGGVTPQILSLACESTNRVRLAWQGEAGLRYGVESRPNVANGPWTRVTFSSGTNSVLATNSLVEATCIVPTADTNRFFRVLEL